MSLGISSTTRHQKWLEQREVTGRTQRRSPAAERTAAEYTAEATRPPGARCNTLGGPRWATLGVLVQDIGDTSLKT